MSLTCRHFEWFFDEYYTTLLPILSYVLPGSETKAEGDAHMSPARPTNARLGQGTQQAN